MTIVLLVAVDIASDLPWQAWLVWFVTALGLSFVRPPASTQEPVDLRAPVTGRWAAINSPASTVPSHGVRTYGQSHAVDILHPRPLGTEPKVPVWGGFRRPEEFSSFGEPV